MNFVAPDGLFGWLIQAENFVLMHNPETTSAVETLIPGMPANHYVGQLYSLAPEITNGLLQANQTLGECIIDSADYLANQALHDLLNGATPLALDVAAAVVNSAVNEFNQATTPPKYQTPQLYFQQGSLK